MADTYPNQLLAVIAAATGEEKAALLAAIEPPADGTLWQMPPLPQRPGRPPGYREGDPPRRRKGVQDRTSRLHFLHAIHHIELSAIDLAALLCLRASGAPRALHFDFLRVAEEEAIHAGLLDALLTDEGFPPGSDPIHHRLWASAVAAGDLGAQLVVVPRFLEARGLDVSAELLPRLEGIDRRSHQVISRIYHDEIGHVGLGSTWHHWWCNMNGQVTLDHFSATLHEHFFAQVPGPFTLDRSGRIQAGFSDQELAVLTHPPWR